MKYIKEEDAKEIARLFNEEGRTMRALAKEYGISEATVSNYIHNRTSPRPRKKAKPNTKPRRAPVVKVFADAEFKEMVLKDLPDEVLFQHVRESSFIG